MTALRKRMLEELQRRNYSPETTRLYLGTVKDFARYFGKSPDKLGQEDLRQYQLYLLNERKLSVGTIVARIAALRFFFVKVLRRPYRQVDLVYPKQPERLPVILSEKRMARPRVRQCSYHRRDSDDVYGTECADRNVRLKLTDIAASACDPRSPRQGNRDRRTLSPRLLEVLREYWKWRNRRSLCPRHNASGENHRSNGVLRGR